MKVSSPVRQFEDVVAWQKAKLLSIATYRSLKDCRDFAFRDQIQRASVSAMNNIAEGFERRSNKEFRQFLFIAKGSCGEVRSMILLGLELGYLDEDDAGSLAALAVETSRLIAGFIKSLQE